MKQCVMREGETRCENDGVPEPGFKFYVCEACLEKLEGLMEAIAVARRHAGESDGEKELMSRSLNNVQILGHLGKDAEVKFTPSGIQVARFSLATSRSYKDKQSGEWKEKTTWHNIVLWRCENVVEFLKKGKQICVQGYLDSRSYEKDGVKHYVTEVVSEQMILCGGGDGSRAAAGGSRPSPAAQAEDPGGQGITDDDVPF